MWALRYLFYRLYRWQARCWRDEDVSFNVLVLMVVFFCLNLVALLAIAESIAGRSFLLGNVPQAASRIGLLLLGALIAVPLYFAFIHAKKYKQFVEEFEVESAYQRRTRGMGVLLYVVLSIVFLFAGAILHGKMISH
jgi:hypothetical protein